MQPIQNLLHAAMSPPATAKMQPLITKTDWSFDLVGNETADERATLSLMLAEAKRFVSDFAVGGAPRWLSLVGRPGSGKTHLARQIAAFMRERGESLYNANVRAGLDPKGQNYETAWSYAQEGPIFAKWLKVIDAGRNSDFGPAFRTGRDWCKVIDDIGAEGMDGNGRPYAFAVNTLGKVADQRVGKWTVITSNYTRKELAELFDPRISSRMIRDGSVVVDASNVRDFNIRREAWRTAA